MSSPVKSSSRAPRAAAFALVAVGLIALSGALAQGAPHKAQFIDDSAKGWCPHHYALIWVMWDPVDENLNGYICEYVG